MIQVDLLKPAGKSEPATLDRPLDHLVACHQRIEDKLVVLERAVAHLEDRTDEALYACHSVGAFLDAGGKLHTEDEEESVFPRIRKHAVGEELTYLDNLELQHREVEAFVSRLKNQTKHLERDPALRPVRETLVQTALKLAALYRAHMASENEVLTRIGRAHLDEVDLAEIAFEMRLRRSHAA